MENDKETKPLNFIEKIIEDDLREGRVPNDTIVTRFPPEPNGYLHIGHIKSICLNFGLAEKYKGICHLRLDDTNPAKEDMEYINSIKDDIHWLGFDWGEHEYYASDYYDQLYEIALDLIRKGKAYVDSLSPEEMKEYRGTLKEPGKESPCRNQSVEENLKLFEDMRAGKFADGERVLRAKIDMASPNINMRDPIIYRIAHITHHNTGDKWCIYPMYDFAHPIEDAIEGITHSICTLEFEDHRPLYDWVLREVGWWETPPQQIEFARLDITNTVMSKRYLKALVDDGVVEGWDDPRMPTIAGLRRRGYTPEAIRDFCERIGVAKSNSQVEVSLLEHCVREDLQDKVSNRNVIEKPIKVVITNYPEDKTEMITIENHNKIPEMGTREVPFSRELYIDGDDFMEVPAKKYFRMFPGNEVRFKGAYFIKCNEVVKNEDGSIRELLCTYDPESRGGESPDGRKVKGTIHWVDAKTAVKIRIRNYDYLMIPDEEGKNQFNPDSVEDTWGYAEPSVADVEPGERFQFFRHGYYIADSKLTTDEEKVFNRIVGLKSSWKPAK